MGEIGADLDQLSESEDAKAEGRKPGEKRVDKPAVKSPENGAKNAPEAAKHDSEAAKDGEAAAKDAPEPTKLNDLRSAYSTLKKRVKDEFEPQIQTLQAKIKELEGQNPPEVKTLQQRLESAEKRRDELETRIAELDFKSSKAFKDKYEQPYIDAWQDAISDLKELTVELEDGSTRGATQEDLVKLANMPLGEARRVATAMFGASADDVMIHRRKILDLSNAQSKALADARTEAVERSKMSDVKRKSDLEQNNRLWAEANDAIVKKWPKMFGQIEGDDEGNALLTKGEAMADRLFSPTDENRPKTIEEAVHLHAMIRNKVRNHDRLALWLKRAREKIKELETSLSEYQSSDPNGGLGGRPTGGAGKTYLQEAEEELDALDKRN